MTCLLQDNVPDILLLEIYEFFDRAMDKVIKFQLMNVDTK